MGATRGVRWFKWGGLGLVLFVMAMGLYSGWVVYEARQYTTSSVLPAVRQTRFPLALSDLTPRQLEILLEVEDPNFFHHHGVDLSTPGAGITTITQGLVKQLYFHPFKPGFAKLRQTLIAAFALDPLMPKREQLALFVNSVYLGHGVHGFAEAAQHYFARPFAKLDEDQYLALVAMIIAPEVFDLQRYPARNAERVARIKRLASGAYRPRGRRWPSSSPNASG